MTELEQILIKRDGLSLEEAEDLIEDARESIVDYDDIDDFMADWFGLEPDYIFDVLL